MSSKSHHKPAVCSTAPHDPSLFWGGKLLCPEPAGWLGSWLLPLKAEWQLPFPPVPAYFFLFLLNRLIFMETAGMYMLWTFNLLSNLVEKLPSSYYGGETRLEEICFLGRLG